MEWVAGWYDVEIRARERTGPSRWTFVNRLIARVYAVGLTPRPAAGPGGLSVGDRVEISYVHLYDTPTNPTDPREPAARLSASLARGSYLGVATIRRDAEPKVTPPAGPRPGRVVLDLKDSSLGLDGPGTEITKPGAIDHVYFLLRVASPLNPTGAAKNGVWDAKTPTLWIALRADNVITRVLGFESLAVLSARFAMVLNPSGAPAEFGGAELLPSTASPSDPAEPSPIASRAYPFRITSAEAPLRDLLDRLRPGSPHGAYVPHKPPRGYDNTRVPAILSQPESTELPALVTAGDPEQRWLPLTRFDHALVAVVERRPDESNGGVWTFAVLLGCPDWRAPRERPAPSDEQPATLTPPALRPYGLRPRFDAAPGTPFESVLSARESALPWSFSSADVARVPSRWNLGVRFRGAGEPDDDPPTDLRAWWNARVCRATQDALRSVRDSSTASFLPTLRDPQRHGWSGAKSPIPPPFMLRYPVIEHVSASPSERPMYSYEAPSLAALGPFVSTLDTTNEGVPPAPLPTFDVVAEFDGATPGDGSLPIRRRYTVAVGQGDRSNDEVPDLLWIFKPAARAEGQQPVETRLRIGSMAVVVDDTTEVNAASTAKRLRFRGETLVISDASAADSDFCFRVVSFEPCGDEWADQRRDGDTAAERGGLHLVLADSRARKPLATFKLTLRVSESLGGGRDHSLRLSIERTTDAPSAEDQPTISAVVVRARPLEVARVTTTLTLERTQIALWSRDASGRSSWRLSVDPRFRLTLPPQAVVEDTVDDPGDVPARPFRVALGPPMQVDLLSTGRARRMNLAPWSLQDLLADPQDEIPGAWIQSLRTEILFGLRVRSTASYHHLAELDASLGQVPSVPSPEDLALASRGVGTLPEKVFRAHSEDLLAKRRSLRDRLRWYELVSRLEPGVPVESVEVTPTLRNSGVNPRGVPLSQWPVKGGALWGIKSDGIRRQAEDDPAATGRLEAPAFTPLGAFGRQVASFNGGLSKLYATVRMGRVLDYKFERRGRIAILGHPARYVVIYRRYSARDGGLLDGVAALRKVEEYVEIEVPRRLFPEPGAEATSAGPLASASFPQNRQVRVDASRGWDSRVGWVLPLTSGGEDPSLVLSFLDVDGKHVESGISNPEILNFFTATTQDASPDPSAWPWYSDIDGPSADLAKPTAAPSALRPGVERFTFHLARAPRVNVVARRFKAPVEVALENVTLARSVWSDAGSTAAEVSSLLGSSLDALVRHGGDQTALTPAGVAAELQQGLRSLARDADLLTKRIRRAPNQFIQRCYADLLALSADLRADAEDGVRRVRTLIEFHAQRCLAIEERSSLVDAAARTLEEIAREIAAEREAIERLAAGVSEAQLRHHAAALVVIAQRWIARLATRIGHVGAEPVSPIVGAVQRFGAELIDRLKRVFDHGGGNLRERFVAAVKEELEALRTTLDGAAAPLLAMRAQIDKRVGQWRVDVGSISKDIVQDVRALVVGNASLPRDELVRVLGGISGRIAAAAEHAASALAEHVAVLDGALDVLADRATAYAKNAEPILKAFESLTKDTSAELRRELERVLGGAVTSIPRSIDDLAREAYRTALKDVGREIKSAAGLELRRAFGAAPKANTLDFCLGGAAVDRLEYLFEREVRTTVVDAVANARSALSVIELPAFNLRLPIKGIGEQLIPEIPSGFDLTKLLPKVAGLDLATILGQAAPRLGGGLKDVVSLKHGFDRVERRAWLHASLDTRRDAATDQALKNVSLLDAGGIAILLKDVRIEAGAEVSADLAGRVVQHTSAAVGAHWELQFAGTRVLTLSDTSLSVDGDGRVTFSVSPEKIEVPEALRFLNELLSSIGPKDSSGLSLSIAPQGVSLRYGITLPTLQTGAFSISGVSLQAALTLGLVGGVSLEIGAGVSSRERPFVLTILFLGGGGWFEAGVRKTFSGGDVVPRPRIDLGIAVGASVPFDIGVARGGVQFLVYASLQWSGGGGVAIVIGASLRGELEILGIISVGVYVSLEVTYESGGTLTLRGRLEVKIKVFFFSVKVSTGFSKRLGGGTRAWAADALDAHGADPVDEYLNDFTGYARALGGVR